MPPKKSAKVVEVKKPLLDSLVIERDPSAEVTIPFYNLNNKYFLKHFTFYFSLNDVRLHLLHLYHLY